MRRQREGLLHPALARIVAGIGHGQTLVLADAGLPIPPGVERIDLAVTCGVPGLAPVLEAVVAELAVERAIIAREASEAPASGKESLPQLLSRVLSPGTPVEAISHEELKARSAQAVAVVRTGECTPYWNVILVAGVSFP
jgi:D-ribose pyranase